MERENNRNSGYFEDHPVGVIFAGVRVTLNHDVHFALYRYRLPGLFQPFYCSLIPPYHAVDCCYFKRNRIKRKSWCTKTYCQKIVTNTRLILRSPCTVGDVRACVYYDMTHGLRGCLNGKLYFIILYFMPWLALHCLSRTTKPSRSTGRYPVDFRGVGGPADRNLK